MQNRQNLIYSVLIIWMLNGRLQKCRRLVMFRSVFSCRVCYTDKYRNNLAKGRWKKAEEPITEALTINAVSPFLDIAVSEKE